MTNLTLGTHVLMLVSSSLLAMTSESASALSFTKVEAGQYHSCGLSPEQRLWCWGMNAHGVLGTGHSTDTIAATPRPLDLQKVTSVSMGLHHTCAIADGRAWCWGSNEEGQLGIGDVEYRLVPTQVGGELAGRTDVTAISAGGYSSCAIADERIYCWGRGAEGQIGNGLNEPQQLPASVDLYAASAIAVGVGHACAIDMSGVLWCWGHGADGALGNGSYESSNVPVGVAGMPPQEFPFVQLTAGSGHACALGAITAWCWGRNAEGQLGTADFAASIVAEAIAWDQPAAIIDIDAGAAHTCAIDTDGRAWCWGRDVWGQLGNDFALAVKAVPTPVYAPFGSNATAITAGLEHTCGVTGGITYCWGRNSLSQLGVVADLDYAQVPVPVNVDLIFDSDFDP